MEHSVTNDETWLSLCRLREKDQANEWSSPGEKPPEVVEKERFYPKVMLILAMDIK